MLIQFRELECLMSLKVHFLYAHFDKFSKNLENYSEEQSERFHQDLQEMERMYY